MSYQAVIFDRDGVLTDFDLKAAAAFFEPLLPLSVIELGETWAKWGAEQGFPQSLPEEKQFWRGFWDHLSHQYTLSPATQAQLQQVTYTDFLMPFADARPALLAARQAGLRIGVLSNFTLASLEPSLQVAGLADLVDVACAATVIGTSKPEPEAYLTVSQKLGVAPEHCLFFDDEPVCMAGAQAVGMTAYLVNRTQTEHNLNKNIVANLSALSLLLS
jgi:HAD superfamily hydrolase (TIGR01509 family)